MLTFVLCDQPRLVHPPYTLTYKRASRILRIRDDDNKQKTHAHAHSKAQHLFRRVCMFCLLLGVRVSPACVKGAHHTIYSKAKESDFFFFSRVLVFFFFSSSSSCVRRATRWLGLTMIGGGWWGYRRMLPHSISQKGDRARALGIYGAAVGCVPFNPKSSAEKLEKDPVGRQVSTHRIR